MPAISITALMVTRCSIQGSTSSIPRISTVKDGSSKKPDGGTTTAEMLWQKGISIAAYLTTGGRCIERYYK